MMPPILRSRSCLHHLLDRLEVGLEHRLVLVALADEAAGVDVDRGQRLGLIENQVAARLEPHLAIERALDLRLDLEMVEDRLRALIQRDARAQPRHVVSARTARSARRSRDRRTRACRPRWKTGRARCAARRRDRCRESRPAACSRSCARIEPTAWSETSTSRWISRLLTPSHAVRTMKPPCARPQFPDGRAQPRAFLGALDSPRDPDVIAGRHVDQMTPGQRDRRGQPRALGAHRLLGDLDDDVLAAMQLLLDREPRALLVHARPLGALPPRRRLRRLRRRLGPAPLRLALGGGRRRLGLALDGAAAAASPRSAGQSLCFLPLSFSTLCCTSRRRASGCVGWRAPCRTSCRTFGRRS